PQRLLPRVRVPSAAQEVEPLPEPLEQTARPEDARPRRCQLDREREPLEPGDEAGDLAVPLDPGTLAEELDAVPVGERRELEGTLAGDAQERAARHQQRQVRTRAEQPAESGRGGDELLEVVEQDQDVPVADGRGDVVGAERGADLLRYELGLPDRGERYEEDPVAVLVGAPVEHPPRQLEREPRLALPARADDGDQARAEERDRCVLELVLPPEERRDRRRQVRVRRRLQRGERFVSELEQADGAVEVTDPQLAEIVQLDPLRQLLLGEP